MFLDNILLATGKECIIIFNMGVSLNWEPFVDVQGNSNGKKTCFTVSLLRNTACRCPTFSASATLCRTGWAVGTRLG